MPVKVTQELIDEVKTAAGGLDAGAVGNSRGELAAGERLAGEDEDVD
jgi:hypothetical protein